jgi:sulfite reductase (NADPH) hemoprotein beta-component
MQGINQCLIDTIAACGDVNRNVMAGANPMDAERHPEILELGRALSQRLLPRTKAYHEIWLDGELATTSQEADDDEPLYGKQYLPRKFKTVIAVPPDNDVDIFAHDLGYIAIVEEGRIIGYNVTVGGGMGMTHGRTDTFPRTADVLGFCTPEQALPVAEAVLTTQRDFGNRADRAQARLKYTIEHMGLEAFRAEVEKRLGYALEPARPFTFTTRGDRYGWTKGQNGHWHYTLFVENGRIKDMPNRPLKTGLKALAHIHKGTFRCSANQNFIIADVAEADKAAVEEVLRAHQLDQLNQTSGLRRNAMACVAFPTCGLALAESERYLPSLVTEIEETLASVGLAEEEISIRMTGCPNGCARPYLGEIGLVGKGPRSYNLYLGAAFNGERLNKLYKADLKDIQIAPTLKPILLDYAKNREEKERFGDFVIRAGYVAPTTAGNRFHEETGSLK